MTRLQTRLTALEARIGAHDNVAIGFIPESWPTTEGEEALRGLAAEQGMTSPFGIVAIAQDDCPEPELSFFGSLCGLLEKVARESTRIGVTSGEARQ